MSHTVRIADDIVEHAHAEAARRGRSVADQIDHWVRIGREITHDTPSRRRVESARAGTVPISALTREEARLYGALFRMELQQKLHETDFGEILAAEGVVTVVLDDQGRLVEHHPDGTEVVLSDD
ncbi:MULTISPECIES: TA system antitoxin ParD family protein [unclassified Tsukamurella]|uniref:TA system antitoxin ParD family protein n=1 Tax=unclassified Tsukamurella TaxID=2633480 RepID=UPI003016E5BD